MQDRSVAHATFVIERTYDASPARVFGAFSDPVAKASWFGLRADTFEFTVGGHEIGHGGPPGDENYTFHAIYHEIVPGARIVTSYTMDRGETRISASLATTELHAAGNGTRLVYTEQGAFLDGHDTAAEREEGCGGMLDALGRVLAPAAAPAT
jgi:uncharacterized protein YndB with AHSA1/START domain